MKGRALSMSIVVATLRFGEVPYFNYSAKINRQYCHRHGYSMYTIEAPPQTERHPIWYKVRGVRELLPSADLVLFMDADAYFVDHEKTLESLIQEHMGDAAFLVGNDRRDSEYVYSDEDANMGVYLVRNSDEGIGILDDWWNVPLVHGTDTFWQWPLEQTAFNSYVRKGRYSRGIKVIHYAHMNGRDGKFIRHLIRVSDEDRLLTLRAEAADHDFTPPD